VVTRRLRAPRIDFSALRRELELPTEFPPAAQRAAEEAARGGPGREDREDRTDIPFVTLDPASSRDLDQAVHLARRGDGYRVSYAIADVAAFVPPGGPLDVEANHRGQTVYLPDGKVPLHPPVLSEGTASLLPDQPTPAVLWSIDVDSAGEPSTVDVRRALVRSRAKLSYTDTQAALDAGRLPEPLRLLPEIGKLLIDAGLARGAIDLPMPDQEIEPDGDGFRLELRAPVPVEEYNAQISLLTGRVAAAMMLAGRVGVLRTMPPAPPEAMTTLRKAARALRVDWPAGESVGALLARLNPARPRAAALIEQAADLLRGAAYTAFDGAVPDRPAHAAVAAPYAHVTAPLRRLADRYATEVCLALHHGREVPPEVRAALPGLPETMARTDRVANAAERGAIDLVEAVLLRHRVGQEFEAAVVDVDPKRDRGTVALDEPAVRARCDGHLTLGERTTVRLMEATPQTRTVRFEPARV
jgi:exoribonuclease R